MLSAHCSKVVWLVRSTLTTLALFLISALLPGHAHFQLNLNVRIFHVEHLADGLRVHHRVPMPYLVASLVGPEGANGLPQPAPYTRNAMEEDMLMHYVAGDEFAANPLGLGEIAGNGLKITTDGKDLAWQVEDVRIYAVGQQPDFASLEEAREAFSGSYTAPDPETRQYVGDTVVDVILRYNSDGAVRRYQLSGTLDPGLPDQENTANLVLDYGPGGDRVLRATGLLYEPLEVTRSRLAAATTFVKEGFRHILEGLDHVLFVLCMVLGALTLGSLVWRVTGFTLGHSVTLTLGFFGFVPSGRWFIPTVEIIIALTIIYAALVAMFPKRMHAGNNRKMFAITAGIGLLHGLGFSFVLHKILKVTSPDIWQSLLAFNVGIEIGQLTIILVAWPLFLLINRMSHRAWIMVRNSLATAFILVAVFWTWERSVGMLG